jgi:signal transduction protein with GAF and PtsI domain
MIHSKKPCEIGDVGPFLAAPIKEEDETIGVVRIPRREESKPFEKIDEELLVAFADQLSLTIGNIKKKKTIDDIRKKRAKEFETRFSTPLIDVCKNVSKIRQKTSRIFITNPLILKIGTT